MLTKNCAFYMEGQVMKETIRNKNTIYGGNNQNKLEERIEED
jgi:hypothetical protein